ncbi:hypothetical protein Fmac_022953 [Flemingia macrophylla]|uniref:Phlebovirus glycoprotein G2 fusion domain-containing protein n=1 Tax=Flemingia macrophylla TaxID=520843 RepID=A0ABD1LK50_9FABA
MVGSIANLYQSVENISDTYMQPNLCKDVLLKPRALQISALLPLNDDGANFDSISKSFYLCPSRCDYNMTCDNETRCQCRRTMSREEVVTYMIMDDLVIEPISSITLINKFNIKEAGALQEKVVKLGMAQAVNILEASLRSKMVLTITFLKKNMES